MTPSLEAENSAGNADFTGLALTCMYGPNSPRQRSNSAFSESATVSVLSELVSEESEHYVDGNLPNPTFGIRHSDANL